MSVFEVQCIYVYLNFQAGRGTDVKVEIEAIMLLQLSLALSRRVGVTA